MLNPVHFRNQNITLSRYEHMRYQVLLTLLPEKQGYKEHTKYFSDILDSETYSLDFKKALVIALPFLRQGRLWAYANSEGEELYGFVVAFLRDAPQKFGKRDVECLTENSSLTAYAGESYDVVDYLLKRLSDEILVDDYILAEHLVTCLIERDLMTLGIAERILALNVGIQNSVSFTQQPYDEQPLIAWARTKHDFDIMPDSWVLKFLTKP